MIRFSDVQAAQLADFFDQLHETVSSVNDFIDAASSGPANADQAAQLRAQTASIREKAAAIADVLANQSKERRSDRPWANRGRGATFGGLGTTGAAGGSKKMRGSGKTTPSGS